MCVCVSVCVFVYVCVYVRSCMCVYARMLVNVNVHFSIDRVYTISYFHCVYTERKALMSVLPVLSTLSPQTSVIPSVRDLCLRLPDPRVLLLPGNCRRNDVLPRAANTKHTRYNMVQHDLIRFKMI